MKTMQAGQCRQGSGGGGILRDALEYKLIGCIPYDISSNVLETFKKATHTHHAQHFWQDALEYKMISHLVFETIFSSLM